MSRYSIKYLERLTGIKAHTIRIWEKRYGLLTPDRTDTNIRYYNDDQLRKVLNIRSLLDSGYKISQVANLTEEGFNVALQKILDDPGKDDRHLDIYRANMISAGLKFDSDAFEKTFNSCILKYGFTETIENVLYPTLRKIGVLWQREELNPAQEHFVSNLARLKLFSAIDGVIAREDAGEKYLLFLPFFEEHEIGLLYSYYLLSRSGKKAFYLGQRVPTESLKTAISSIRPTHLVLFIVSTLPVNQANKYLSELAACCTGEKILLCGNAGFLKTLKLPRQIRLMTDIPDFTAELENGHSV